MFPMIKTISGVVKRSPIILKGYPKNKPTTKPYSTLFFLPVIKVAGSVNITDEKNMIGQEIKAEAKPVNISEKPLDTKNIMRKPSMQENTMGKRLIFLTIKSPDTKIKGKR